MGAGADMPGFSGNAGHEWMMAFLEHGVQGPNFLRRAREFPRRGPWRTGFPALRIWELRRAGYAPLIITRLMDRK
jgi:hypothetical protein